VCEGLQTHEIMGRRSRAPKPIECVGAGIWTGKSCRYGKLSGRSHRYANLGG
jgi:hypothetical protein